jgi:dihydroorotase
MNVTTPMRRHLLAGAAGAALIALAPRIARAAMGPNDKFDLLIRNANVLDPSQGLAGKRDIGIRYGMIEAIESSIAPERALRVMDAGNRLVTPGLIDLHAHTFAYGSAIGIPADELIAHQGTTTVVSAGDAGANNIAAFRRLAMPAARTRQFAFVHIAVAGLAGFPVPELFNIDYAQVDVTARAIAENADFVLGVKVRMSENVIARHGLEPLKRAIAACEKSGVPAKVMCHIGGVQSRELMSQILDLLRAGDVLTHCYSGVVFDVGHGGGSFDYTIAEAAIQQGCPPDTISSDIHVFSGNSPGMPYLSWVMSKFLNMGFTLEQVVTMATANPARVIGRVPKLGTLQHGAPADLSLFDVVEGPVLFVDTRNNERNGKIYLSPWNTVIGGVASGRPYQAPFTVR